MGSFQKFLSEAVDWFPDMHEMKFDPDRTDTHDIVQGLVPLLVKVAYTHFMQDKEKHERTFSDPDDPKFKMTADELADRVDDLITDLRERLSELPQRDILAQIKAHKKDFKVPLEDA